MTNVSDRLCRLRLAALCRRHLVPCCRYTSPRHGPHEWPSDLAQLPSELPLESTDRVEQEHPRYRPSLSPSSNISLLNNQSTVVIHPSDRLTRLALTNLPCRDGQD